ncbi:hypothetical protein STEG23_021069 [Scotinomys teguina]
MLIWNAVGKIFSMCAKAMVKILNLSHETNLNFTLSQSKENAYHTSSQPILCCPNVLEYVVFYWSVVNPLEATLIEKTVFTSSSS